MRAWGLAIEPCADPNYLGAATADVVYAAPGSRKGYVLAEAFRFLVQDCPNLLGLDFLVSGRCVLDLDPLSPRLLVPWQARAGAAPDGLLCVVALDGGPVEACIDTGFSNLLATPRADAQTLGLRLEENPVKYVTQAGLATLTHVARGVAVAAFGKQVVGDAVVHDLDGVDLLVGMAFLKGARIRFGEGGGWDLEFPARRADASEGKGKARLKSDHTDGEGKRRKRSAEETEADT